MIRVLIALTFFSMPSHAEKAQLLPVATMPPAIQENAPEIPANEAYQILKLETKINDLYSHINSLSLQIKQLDEMQAVLVNRVNELSSKEAEEVLDANIEDNMDEFKYGFEMLSNNNLDRAARSFKLFIEKYPNDSKLGEAYFWLGEIAYKAKDYKTASKNYLICYRDYKTNSRRNDALFKLSITLNLLGKQEEACGGFDLLINDNSSVSPVLRDKVIQEATSSGCRN